MDDISEHICIVVTKEFWQEDTHVESIAIVYSTLTICVIFSHAASW